MHRQTDAIIIQCVISLDGKKISAVSWGYIASGKVAGAGKPRLARNVRCGSIGESEAEEAQMKRYY